MDEDWLSFMTTTFVIEAMAVANARLRGKKCEKKSESDNSNVDEVDPMLSNTGNEAWIHEPYLECNDQQPLVSVRGSRGSDLYDITDRVEMGQMASMFFNKVGVHLFYICIVVYLYGDLAIYAAAVPRSLAFVACGKLSCNNISTTFQDSDFCWDRVTRGQAYRIFLKTILDMYVALAGHHSQHPHDRQKPTCTHYFITYVFGRQSSSDCEANRLVNPTNLMFSL
uniref:Uncharacterized protein n=1 Tax=Eptatretus burgeri TaxID=7764 RepID=A0A8C4RC91_EPTBU